MELSSNDDSDKDQAMKRSFESKSDDTEKSSEKKKAPKKAIFLPVEKVEETKHETTREVVPADQEEAPKKSIFQEILQTDDNEEVKSDEVETEESKGQEPQIEALETDELNKVVETVVESSLVEARQEVAETEAETPEAAEAAASVQFLESIKDKIEDNEFVDDETIDSVAQDVIESIESSGSDDDIEELVDTDDSTEDFVEEDEEDDSSSPALPPAPPTPPVSSVPPLGPAHVPSMPPAGGGSPPEINSPEAPGVPVVAPERPHDEEFIERRSRAGDLLLGGVVGYIVGRRRGRINAEKRLMPVREKLEKEVKELQSRITNKELEVRHAARTRFESQQPTIQPEKSDSAVKTEQSSKKLDNRGEAKDLTLETEEVAEETPEVAEQQQKSEHNQDDVEQKSEKNIPKRTIETMSLPLLLEVAEELSVERVSLRLLYERGVIDQKRLREILKRYMQGESLESLWPETLADEQFGVEKQHEKDAEAADDNPMKTQTTPSSKDEEIQNPTINTATPNHHMYPQESISPVVQTILDEMDQQMPKKSNVASTVALMILAVLAAIVIITIFT